MTGVSEIPLPRHTIIVPVLGIAAWLGIGKVGLEPLAIVLAAVLLGNVNAAVHHAEIIAIRVGEPFGTLILALAVTVIEVGLLVSMMLSGKPNPALMQLRVRGRHAGTPWARRSVHRGRRLSPARDRVPG